jgi:hypothetical protein
MSHEGDREEGDTPSTLASPAIMACQQSVGMCVPNVFIMCS